MIEHHGFLPASSSNDTTFSIWAPREPLTRTASPGRQRALTAAAASAWVEQLRTEPLRHAPSDADDRPRLHVPFELAQPAEHALLSVVADRAGVDEDDVRSVGSFDGIIAMRRELSEHQLGVAHVHLAAVGFDVDGGLWHS